MTLSAEKTADALNIKAQVNTIESSSFFSLLVFVSLIVNQIPLIRNVIFVD